jgi:hypothetical protein
LEALSANDRSSGNSDTTMQHKSMLATTETNILADIDRRRRILETYTSPGIKAKKDGPARLWLKD